MRCALVLVCLACLLCLLGVQGSGEPEGDSQHVLEESYNMSSHTEPPELQLLRSAVHILQDISENKTLDEARAKDVLRSTYVLYQRFLLPVLLGVKLKLATFLPLVLALLFLLGKGALVGGNTALFFSGLSVFLRYFYPKSEGVLKHGPSSYGATGDDHHHHHHMEHHHLDHHQYHGKSR